MTCRTTERMSAPCSVCGYRDDRLHISEGGRFFCSEHCTVCRMERYARYAQETAVVLGRYLRTEAAL